MNWEKVSSLSGEATSDSYSRVNQPNCQLGLLCFHFPLLVALCAQCFWLEHSPPPGRHWESIQLNPNSKNEAVLSLGLDQLLGHLSPPTCMNIGVGSKKPPRYYNSLLRKSIDKWRVRTVQVFPHLFSISCIWQNASFPLYFILTAIRSFLDARERI